MPRRAVGMELSDVIIMPRIVNGSDMENDQQYKRGIIQGGHIIHELVFVQTPGGKG